MTQRTRVAFYPYRGPGEYVAEGELESYDPGGKVAYVRSHDTTRGCMRVWCVPVMDVLGDLS